jgi:hypothetical protein
MEDAIRVNVSMQVKMLNAAAAAMTAAVKTARPVKI